MKKIIFSVLICTLLYCQESRPHGNQYQLPELTPNNYLIGNLNENRSSYRVSYYDINIDFDESMLNWKKGNHQNDGIWWEHWYDNVIETTGFQKYQKRDIKIENEYDSIYNESMEYYNYLKDIK